MRLRNGPDGYGAVTKLLHWATVLAVAAQFVVGYAMEVDDSGHGRGRGRGEGSGRGRGRGGEDDVELFDGRFDLVDLHVLLGLSILALVGVRVIWRASTPLPPWAAQLTEGSRRFLHATEVALLATLVVVPATGIALVLGDDDLLALHVGAHIAFFAALAAHLTIVLRRRLLPRMV